MALKLRVISDHYKALGKRSSRLFGVTGGRIGRAQDNDWVLPDPERYVSSHHCRVEFRAGQWLLEDTSTNGVFINGSDTPASVEGAYVLQDGDRLRVGDYEILVSIDDRNDFPLDGTSEPPRPARAARALPKDVGEDLGEELDLTDLLSDSMIAKPEPAKRAVAAFEYGQAAALGAEAVRAAPAPVAAPAATPAPATPAKPVRSGFSSLLDNALDQNDQRTVAHPRKNEDWQLQTRPYDRKTLTALTSPAAIARSERDEAGRARRAPEVPSAEAASAVEALCRGAGIDPSSLPSDAHSAILTIAGQILREVVLGLMDVMKGRADLKTRLRLSSASQAIDNNPLKLASSVDDAVVRLLDPHGSRYLGTIEAVREAFGELRMHQAALVGAIQAAVDELMNRIEPGDLQQRFDRGLKRGALLGAANKMKYWDLYVEFYQALNQRNEQGFPTLFAEELARTYAERASSQKKK